MKLRTISIIFLSFVLSLQSVAAFETDQYNLPPQPLADTGDEVTEYTEQNLKKAIEKINAEILRRQSCLERKSSEKLRLKCESADEDRARLTFLRSNDAVALEVFKLLGDGVVPFTRSGSWMESHLFRAQPARYKTSYLDSIYSIVPTNYLTISSTVKIYGAEFGTDKIAHFFQQGYTYYKITARAREQGLTREEAGRRAIRWGQKTERTFYGTLISGVYSNGDLCANYVGMRFYEGLTREIKIKDKIRPAVLRLEDGIWQINPEFNLPEMLVKPFLTEHLNEALNPSIYTNLIGLRAFVRQIVKKQSCRQWLAQKPDLSRAKLNETSQRLMRWNDEDYGFTASRHFITIADTCFGDEQSKTESNH